MKPFFEKCGKSVSPESSTESGDIFVFIWKNKLEYEIRTKKDYGRIYIRTFGYYFKGPLGFVVFP